MREGLLIRSGMRVCGRDLPAAQLETECRAAGRDAGSIAPRQIVGCNMTQHSLSAHTSSFLITSQLSDGTRVANDCACRHPPIPWTARATPDSLNVPGRGLQINSWTCLLVGVFRRFLIKVPGFINLLPAADVPAPGAVDNSWASISHLIPRMCHPWFLCVRMQHWSSFSRRTG